MFLIAQGKQVGWMDILGAGLDLAGPLGKIAGAFVGTLAGYKLGVAAFGRLSTQGFGLLASFVRVTFEDIWAIVRGHAWTKHARDWAELGLQKSDDLVEIVQGITKGPAKQLRDGRAAWYDDARNIVVIFDPKNADKGTVFRPDLGRAYFEGLK